VLTFGEMLASVGVSVAVMLIGRLVEGRYAQVAVIDPAVTVALDLQYLMILPLALKETVPAVEVVMVMVLVMPKVKVVEAKEMLAVADPAVMVMVVTEEVSAR